MPEWPDLAVLRRRLSDALVGRRIEAADVYKPIVLRLPVAGSLADHVAGRLLERIAHRGKYLLFHLENGSGLVVNPMLAGLFSLDPATVRVAGDTCIMLRFEGGREVRYRDAKQMGKVYYLPDMRETGQIPGFAEQGPDADPAILSFETFRQRAAGRRCEVRNLLLDQGFIAGIGNAYADEILFAAGLHPKRKVQQLGPDDWHNLWQATRTVLASALERVEAELPPKLGVKVRDHLQVRGRAGEPCPRCGTRIVRRHLGYLETDFCPKCQPAPPGQIY